MSGYYTKRHRQACAEAVRYLISRGYVHAEHRAREGEDDDRGDIAGIPGFVIEVKTGQTPRWSEWMAQLDAELGREWERTGRETEGIILWRPKGVTKPSEWLAVRRFRAEVRNLLDADGMGASA